MSDEQQNSHGKKEIGNVPYSPAKQLIETDDDDVGGADDDDDDDDDRL